MAGFFFPKERDFVMELTRLVPTIQTAQTLAQDFFEMMRKRVEPAFDSWYKRVQQNGIAELKSFADVLLTDEQRSGPHCPASGTTDKQNGKSTD